MKEFNFKNRNFSIATNFLRLNRCLIVLKIRAAPLCIKPSIFILKTRQTALHLIKKISKIWWGPRFGTINLQLPDNQFKLDLWFKLIMIMFFLFYRWPDTIIIIRKICWFFWKFGQHDEFLLPDRPLFRSFLSFKIWARKLKSFCGLRWSKSHFDWNLIIFLRKARFNFTYLFRYFSFSWKKSILMSDIIVIDFRKRISYIWEETGSENWKTLLHNFSVSTSKIGVFEF